MSPFTPRAIPQAIGAVLPALGSAPCSRRGARLRRVAVQAAPHGLSGAVPVRATAVLVIMCGSERNARLLFDTFGAMQEPKPSPQVEEHLAESRLLLAEMDALLKRLRNLMLGRPTLVAKTADKDNEKSAMPEITKQEVLRRAAEFAGLADVARSLGASPDLVDAWMNAQASIPDGKLLMLAVFLENSGRPSRESSQGSPLARQRTSRE